ncbi:hypothetical protein, partial [Vibrio parahaemolyticus]|uniref:hypothetical protein n=1 Tax=Vibrio parahaemolyticus TaxID=670 RepID=UPI00192A278D
DGSNAAGSKITGGLVTLTATGAIGASGANNEIDTAAVSLDESSTTAGDIFLGEANGVDLLDIDTANGSITIVTGGATTATAVDAGTTGSDVNITVSTGDITVNHVSAASSTTGDDVTIA